MNEAPAFKPKMSVALSGTVAGNTAICTVGRTGNDLHYRGYDILDIAETCEFEEVAYLIVHEKLPNQAELDVYKAHLKSMRDLPAAVKTVLEQLPASTHPMDVMRTGCSALGCQSPEAADHNSDDARQIIDRLMASFGSMLVYWYHFSHSNKRIELVTDDDSIGGHFLHLLHGKPAPESWVRAMHISLILYAEHEFNASTFAARVITGTLSDMHSAVTGAIGALRGALHGGANEAAMALISKFETPAAATAGVLQMLADKDLIMGFGHRVYKSYDPRAAIIREMCHRVLKGLGQQASPLLEQALKLEEIALEDEYFIEKNLYPNVDFYSGIIYQALGIPKSMFTVMFAIARCVGWVTNWSEMVADPTSRIGRPRQLYKGPGQRDYLPVSDRS